MTNWIDPYLNKVIDDYVVALGKSAAPGCPDAGAARRAGRINPDVPAQDLARAAEARKWREGKGWSRRELAALSGFSASAILDFERGYRLGHSGNERLPDSAWLRYGLICAATDAELWPLF